MAMPLLVLLLTAAAILVVWTPPKPQPLRVRRNPLQEEVLARYLEQRR
ncbi:MAG TPA: hypothetical protein VM307_06245 [Egibacteraceae bacterium]|nr:hypothetical protein [Egibacteraceae bacterium]